MAAVRNIGFVMRLFGPYHRRKVFGGLCTVQNLVGIGAEVAIICVLTFCALGLEMPIHAPKIGFRGDRSNRCRDIAIFGQPCAETRRMTYRPIVKIGLLARAQREPKNKAKICKGILINQHVTSHVFAQTTHVVAAPCGFAKKLPRGFAFVVVPMT